MGPGQAAGPTWNNMTYVQRPPTILYGTLTTMEAIRWGGGGRGVRGRGKDRKMGGRMKRRNERKEGYEYIMDERTNKEKKKGNHGLEDECREEKDK